MEDDSATHDGLGVAIGRCTGLFYADAGIIVSRDQECLQGDINVIIVLFRKFGLMVNVAKSENMNCQEGVI